MTLPSVAGQAVVPQLQAYMPYAGTEAPFAKREAADPAWMLYQRAQEEHDQNQKQDYLQQLIAGRQQVADLTRASLAQQLLQNHADNAAKLGAAPGMVTTPDMLRMATGTESTPFFNQTQQQRPLNEQMHAMGAWGTGAGRRAEFAGQFDPPELLQGMTGAAFRQGTPTAIEAAAAGASGRNQPSTTDVSVGPGPDGKEVVHTERQPGLHSAPAPAPSQFNNKVNPAAPSPTGGSPTAQPAKLHLEVQHTPQGPVPMLVLRNAAGAIIHQQPVDSVQDSRNPQAGQ